MSTELVVYSQAFVNNLPIKSAVIFCIDCKDELHKQKIIEELKGDEFNLFSMIMYMQLKRDKTNYIDIDTTLDEPDKTKWPILLGNACLLVKNKAELASLLFKDMVVCQK